MKKILFILILSLFIFIPNSNAKFVSGRVGGAYSTGGAATITSIVLHAIVRIETSNQNDMFSFRIYCEGTTEAFDATFDNLTTSYTELTQAWATNPETSVAWVESDLDGLKIGAGIGAISNPVRITQMWMVVNWSDMSTDTYRPNADFYDGGWVDEGAGSVLYDSIDEAVSDNDTTYVTDDATFTYFYVNIEDPV